jgi:hypothetical protein
MNFKLHSLVFGLVGVVYGLADVLVPELVLRSNAMADVAAPAAPVRFAGCLCIAWSLTAVLARDTADAAAQRAILLGGLAYSVLATSVTAYSYFAGVAGTPVWSLLLLTVPMGGNAARLLLARRRG